MKFKVVTSLALAIQLGSATILFAAQFFGAIFTTKIDGTTVNGNVYEAKEDVYLNGGPQNTNANGLPNGTYYFQVTDPSGSTLLSTDDAACRQMIVANGVVSGPAGSCPHATGNFNPANNSTTVQLVPFDDTPNPGGEYKVWLIAQTSSTTIDGTDARVLHFLNSDAKTDNFKVRGNSQTPPVAIYGSKFYDVNANGSWDANEAPIAGWRIEKVPPTSADVDFTASNGSYSFIVSPDSGSYTITELPPGGWYPATKWLNTTATSGSVNVGNSDIAGPTFGNVCLGGGGGLTLGFWSNNNGSRMFTSSDLAFLVSLNLRNGTGANFNPTSYSQFRSWLLSATATNMDYMLSAQLSAMELNVRHGFVGSGKMVYAPGTNSANSSGFASVQSIMDEANTSLASNGYTVASGATRTYQESLKNALDRANNNLNFVQSEPCAFTTPY